MFPWTPEHPQQGLPPTRSPIEQHRREAWFRAIACPRHTFPQRDCNLCWGRLLFFLDEAQRR
jgi:hypothetical protein